MASGSSGRLFGLDEVVAEIDNMTIPGPVVDDEDWSDDEFDGYVGEPDDEQKEEEETENNEQIGDDGNGLEIGGECEVGRLVSYLHILSLLGVIIPATMLLH